MQINSIEKIEWKVMEPLPGEFPCYACHGVNGNATHFIHAEFYNKYTHFTTIPVCEKCADYARIYPTWLEEMLFQRRMEAAAAMKPESVPATAFGF